MILDGMNIPSNNASGDSQIYFLQLHSHIVFLSYIDEFLLLKDGVESLKTTFKINFLKIYQIFLLTPKNIFSKQIQNVTIELIKCQCLQVQMYLIICKHYNSYMQIS